MSVRDDYPERYERGEATWVGRDGSDADGRARFMVGGRELDGMGEGEVQLSAEDLRWLVYVSGPAMLDQHDRQESPAELADRRLREARGG